MSVMRPSFLLVLVPALAVTVASGRASADVATPGEAALPARGPKDPPLALAVGGQRVTVGFGPDGKIHVRVAGGGELVLEPAGRAYVDAAEWRVAAELVTTAAPVPLVKVSSRPEACSDFWDIYVSIVDGVPEKALELDGLADPPTMSTQTVKFRGDLAVVTTRTEEDEKHVRVRRAQLRWNGRTYGPDSVSKRASIHSK